MKEEKLNRQQRRIKERIEIDAHNQLNKLVKIFFDSFMEEEPDGPELTAKRKELNAKWKMICHRLGLTKEAQDIFDKEADAITKRYQEEFSKA